MRRQAGPAGGSVTRHGPELALPLAAIAVVVALGSAPRGAVAASTLTHAGLLVVGAVVLWRLERWPARADPWLAAALGLLAEHQLLLRAGTLWGDDARLHLWAAAAIAESLSQGVLPFWLHPLGAGVPLLQFYPPLGFAPVVIAHLAGLPLDLSFASPSCSSPWSPRWAPGARRWR